MIRRAGHRRRPRPASRSRVWRLRFEMRAMLCQPRDQFIFLIVTMRVEDQPRQERRRHQAHQRPEEPVRRRAPRVGRRARTSIRSRVMPARYRTIDSTLPCNGM